MRHERRKQYRSYLKFFERTFGVCAPFKIICDGNFLHHFVTHKLGDDAKELHRLLATVLDTEDIQIFVVESALRELEDIGATKTLVLAKQLEPLRVGASLEESRALEPSKAVKKLVGVFNKRKYIVATQDEDLRELLRAIPGVPLLFMQRVLIGLEAPSTKSTEFWSKQEQKKLRAPKDERKRLRELEAKTVGTTEDEPKASKRRRMDANSTQDKKKRKRSKKAPRNEPSSG